MSYLTSTTTEDKTGSVDLTVSNTALWTFNTPVIFGGLIPSTALCGETRLLDSVGAIDPDATDEVAITTTTVTNPSWYDNDSLTAGVTAPSSSIIGSTTVEVNPLRLRCDQAGGDGSLNCLADGTNPVDHLRIWLEEKGANTCNIDDVINVATSLNYIDLIQYRHNFDGTVSGNNATLLTTPPASLAFTGEFSTTSTAATSYLWSKRQRLTDLFSVQLYTTSAGKLVFLKSVAGISKIITSTTTINDGVKHTYKVVLAAGTDATELWIDGFLEGTVTAASMINEATGPTDFRIGADVANGNKFTGVQYYLDVYNVTGSVFLARYYFVDGFGTTTLGDSTGTYDITLSSSDNWASAVELDLGLLVSPGVDYCVEAAAIDSAGVASSYAGSEVQLKFLWNDFYVKPEDSQVVVSHIADKLDNYTVDHYHLFYKEAPTVTPADYDGHVNSLINPYTLIGLTNYDGMAFMVVPCLDTSSPCTNYVESDVVTTSPSNDYVIQEAWISTDQETGAYSGGTEKSFSNTTTTFKNRAVGTYIKDGNIGDPNNTFIRVTLEGALTNSTTISHAAICRQAWTDGLTPQPLEQKCVDSPQRITFGGGNNGATIASGGTLVSDWVPFSIGMGRDHRGTRYPGFWVSWDNSTATTQWYTEVENGAPLASEPTGVALANGGESAVFLKDFSAWTTSQNALTGLGKIEIIQAPEKEIKLNNDNAAITYTGTWTASTADVGHFMGDAKQSSTVNDYYEFTQTGCAFFMTFESKAVSDVISVTVDNLAYDTIDLMSVAGVDHDTILLYHDPSKTCGSHTIRVTKNTAVTTKVDAITVITGALSAHEVGNNASFYGDSITELEPWTQVVSDHYGYQPYEHGIGGGVWSSILGAMFVSLHDDRPRLVTIMNGYNQTANRWQDKDIIQNRARSAIAYAYYLLPFPYAQIIVASSPHTANPDLSNPTRDERLKLMDAWVKEVVAEFPGVLYADVHAATAHSEQLLNVDFIHYDEDRPIANAIINARVLH